MEVYDICRRPPCVQSVDHRAGRYRVQSDALVRTGNREWLKTVYLRCQKRDHFLLPRWPL